MLPTEEEKEFEKKNIELKDIGTEDRPDERIKPSPFEEDKSPSAVRKESNVSDTNYQE